MLWNPLFAIPPADEAEEDRDEERRSSEYITKKDVKYVSLGLVILVIIAIPIYSTLRQNSDIYNCKQNLRAMSTAFATYADAYDDHLPPLALLDVQTGLPRLNGYNQPYTWANTLKDIAGFDPKRTYKCPAAPIDGLTDAEGTHGVAMPMSYGMYSPLSMASKSSILNGSETVLVAETSNGGADESYDPKPLLLGSNHLKLDGFSIGWPTGDPGINLAIPTASPSSHKIQVPDPGVTRLAFRDTVNGLKDISDGRGRHDNIVFVLFADGHYGPLKESQAKNPGYWSVPESGG